MIKYKDYFPRTMLNRCGILPETKLFEETELSLMKESAKPEKVDFWVGKIYSNFENSSLEKNISKEEFENFNLKRRIVSMLCDLDVVSEIEKEKYINGINKNSQISEEKETRISIELPELDTAFLNKNAEKSEKVVFSNKPELEIKGKQK